MDIHTKTASELFKVPPGEVTKDQREYAKRLNYGTMYGSKAEKLVSNLQTPAKPKKPWWRFWQTHDIKWADGTVFMTRYTIFKYDGGLYCWKKFFGKGVHEVVLPPFSLKVHRFRRDDETVHDHPWKFFSLILWRSYDEEQWDVDHTDSRRLVRARVVKRRLLSFDTHAAEHVHRVLVQRGKDCWTLCMTWGRDRVWGFWEKSSDKVPETMRDRWVDNVTHGEETGRHRVTY